MNSVMNDDAQCLDQYLREGSEPAFRKVVERYIALVNSTARRMTGGNVHLAQDITQLVFTDLARKASSLPRGVLLGGWLHRHTCYTALKALRTENRRQKRETIAMELHAINDTSGHDAHWLALAPVLDEALNSLGASDRDVILLRYFQQQDIRSIGQNLGATETAIQKRLGRALEKLRGLLIRRGVTLASATLLGSTLEAGVVTSVPKEHAATISSKAVAGATASTGLSLIYLFAMTTTQKIVAGVAAVLILTGLITVLINQNKAVPSSAVTDTKTNTAVDKSLSLPVRTAQIEAPKLAPASANQSTNAPSTPDDGSSATWSKLQSIVIPRVGLDAPIPLDEFAQTLQTVSKAFDPENQGVKIVVAAGSGPLPKIILGSQGHLSLYDMLEQACQSAGYTLSVEGSIVMLRPKGH